MADQDKDHNVSEEVPPYVNGIGAQKSVEVGLEQHSSIQIMLIMVTIGFLVALGIAMSYLLFFR